MHQRRNKIIESTDFVDVRNKRPHINKVCAFNYLKSDNVFNMLEYLVQNFHKPHHTLAIDTMLAQQIL